MSIASASVGQLALADTPATLLSKVPPKRQTVAVAATMIVPEPR